MYKGKRAKSTKNIYVMASLVLLIAFAVGGTVAYISMKTDPVTNTFTLGTVPIKVVEKLDGNVKKEVAIKNEGTVDAYIRVKVIVNWVSETDNSVVYGQAPVKDVDYRIDYMPDMDSNTDGIQNKWSLGDDGYYYYTEPVKPNAPTEDYLFTNCSPVAEKIPEGYTLSVEILAQSIQADGVDKLGNRPVELAWNVDIVDGEVKAATIVNPTQP